MERPRIFTTRGVGQLAAEACFDQSEIRIVTSTIRSKDALVSLGDDREAAVLRAVDRTLERDHAVRLEHESAGGHCFSV